MYCLARLTSRGGYAWPGMERLALASGLESSRSASRIVKKLIQVHKIVERVEMGGGVQRNGRGRTTRYRVLWDRLREMSESPTPTAVTKTPTEADASLTAGTATLTTARANPDPRAPEPRPPGARTLTAVSGENGIETIHQNRDENTPRRSVSSAPSMDASEEAKAKAALMALGIRGANLGFLAKAGLTAEQITEEARNVSSDPNVRNRPAVLVSRLLERAGIRSPQKPRARPLQTEKDRQVVARLEQMRRERALRAQEGGEE